MTFRVLAVLALLVILGACDQADRGDRADLRELMQGNRTEQLIRYADVDQNIAVDQLAKATFAGGCFWCMERPFEVLDGVAFAVAGYMGGHREYPSYWEVAAGLTGHAEVVQVYYDPNKIGYEQLLEVFWRNVDPLDAKGQFCDRGDAYRSAIFFHDETQKRLALASKKSLENSARFRNRIVTEVTAGTEFYIAERRHQNYYRKNPLRHQYYRYRCGRDRRLQQLWGDQGSPLGRPRS